MSSPCHHVITVSSTTLKTLVTVSSNLLLSYLIIWSQMKNPNCPKNSQLNFVTFCYKCWHFGGFIEVVKTVTNVISRLLDDFDTPNLAGTSDRPKLENINHQPTKHSKNFGFMILFWFQIRLLHCIFIYVQNAILRGVIDEIDSKSCFYDMF